MNAVDRFTRSVCPLTPVTISAFDKAWWSDHPWGWRASPPPASKRFLPAAADVGVIALPKMPAVTPPLIIGRHGTADDIDNIRQNATRHTVDRQPVQMVQLIQEAVDDVVPDVSVAHGIRQRRDQIGKRDHRKVDLLPRFRVFHHAKAIAA